MSRLKDLVIQFESDAELALEGAETFDEFVNTMCKINPIYELSMWQQELRDGWDTIVL